MPHRDTNNSCVEEQPEPDEKQVTGGDSQSLDMPTIGELGRLALDPLRLSDSLQIQTSINSFAGLLNRGSPQE